VGEGWKGTFDVTVFNGMHFELDCSHTCALCSHPHHTTYVTLNAHTRITYIQLIHVTHAHTLVCKQHTHIQSERFLFKLQFENCQPGFELKPRAEGDNLLVCACVDSDFNVLTCDEAENVIVLRVRGKERRRERGGGRRGGEGMEIGVRE